MEHAVDSAEMVTHGLARRHDVLGVRHVELEHLARFVESPSSSLGEREPTARAREDHSCPFSLRELCHTKCE